MTRRHTQTTPWSAIPKTQRHREEPGPVPKPKNDDSVPLRMSRFGPPEPGPEPKPGLSKMNRLGPARARTRTKRQK